jgi:hypothetical protein
MKQGTRSLVFFITFTVAISALGLMRAGASAAPTGVAITATPSITPTATPTPTPVFTATLLVEPEPAQLYVGEIVTVTIDIAVSEGCMYPIFELSVEEHENGAAIFSHVDPPVNLITGPISIPSVWTFRATGVGTASFDARTFGERYCNDYWLWHYLNGASSPVQVLTWPYEQWLPAISGN